MSILDAINGGATALGNGLFPTDPNVAPYVDPASSAAARNNALISLGLGIMRAPYSMTGLGSGLLDAFQGSQQNYQNAMDNAFKHTLIKRQLDQQAQDREFQLSQREIQGKEAALGLKQAERADRTQAATVAQRVLKGLSTAQDPSSYLGLIQNDPDVKDAFQTLGIQAPYVGPLAQPGNLDQFRQQLTTAASAAPPPAPIKLSAGDMLLDPNNPSAPPIASAAPKSTVEWKDDGTQLIPVNNVTGQRVPGLAPIPKPNSNFGGDNSELLAALASHGVSLPAGLRSKQQMAATLEGLRAKFPDKSPDEIATLIGNNQIDFSGNKKASMDFTTGKAGNTVRSLNVAVQHLGTLDTLTDALGNGNLPLLNRVANTWKSQTGQTAPATFEAAKKIVADEVVKAIVGSGGGVADREEAAKTINAAQSPAQLKAVIATYKQLMGGQLEGLRHQYEQSTGKQDFDRFLMDGTKTQLEGKTNSLDDAALLKKWGT